MLWAWTGMRTQALKAGRQLCQLLPWLHGLILQSFDKGEEIFTGGTGEE